jgi:cutinase
MFGAKAIDYCNPEDPICHAGQGNEWKGHTDGYVPVYTSQAASFVQTRLLTVLSPTVPGGPSGPLGVPPGPMGVPPGQAPGQGPLPGPGPQGTSVVDKTQPIAFR